MLLWLAGILCGGPALCSRFIPTEPQSCGNDGGKAQSLRREVVLAPLSDFSLPLTSQGAAEVYTHGCTPRLQPHLDCQRFQTIRFYKLYVLLRGWLI